MARLEIEFKTLLSQEKFNQIKTDYAFAPAFTQTNYYYDTKDRQLKAQHCGLRLRLFADHAEQTLKVPAPVKSAVHHQLLEITDPLTLPQAKILIAHKTFDQNHQVGQALRKRQINLQDLQLLTQATTTRRVCSLPYGDLTLDHTRYLNGHRDFELELETKTPQKAHAAYQALLHHYQICEQPVVNKVTRAFSQM